MDMQRHWISAPSSAWNSSSESVGRSASVALLVATTAATLLCGSGAAHSGPCTPQIEKLEQQIGHASSSAKSGPIAPQSIEAQLHHQPTPETVRDAERKANANVLSALQRARQADSDDNSAACTKALNEVKRYWFIPVAAGGPPGGLVAGASNAGPFALGAATAQIAIAPLARNPKRERAFVPPKET
jgi:hypothetical protein